MSDASYTQVTGKLDLINRQAAIDVARKCPVKEVTPAYMLIDKSEIMTELMMLPSAEPELIRCRECVHNRNCDIQYHAQAGDEFYCGGAERRIDE